MKIRINVKMNRGGTILMEATGRVFKDSYGVLGSPVWWDCDDLKVYWPGGGVVREELYDVEKALQDYVEAVKNYDPY